MAIVQGLLAIPAVGALLSCAHFQGNWMTLANSFTCGQRMGCWRRQTADSSRNAGALPRRCNGQSFARLGAPLQ